MASGGVNRLLFSLFVWFAVILTLLLPPRASVISLGSALQSSQEKRNRSRSVQWQPGLLQWIHEVSHFLGLERWIGEECITIFQRTWVFVHDSHHSCPQLSFQEIQCPSLPWARILFVLNTYPSTWHTQLIPRMWLLDPFFSRLASFISFFILSPQVPDEVFWDNLSDL